MHIPEGLAEKAARAYNGSLESTSLHFELVHHQFKQIRSAFALAVALRRTLVLPEIICALDRVWFPHKVGPISYRIPSYVEADLEPES
eukprot:scaffold5297_cov374-Prasinococcus_capsulatus_cf.AAC.12